MSESFSFLFALLLFLVSHGVLVSSLFYSYLCTCIFYCRSYRMSHIFVDVENVCEMQQIVEDIIGDAVESNTLGVIQQRRRRTRLNDRKLEKWFKYR